jgi:hypothetical protein
LFIRQQTLTSGLFYGRGCEERNKWVKGEICMAVVKNLARAERIIRAIVGAVLIAAGFSFHGFWRPLFFVIGVLFLFTAFVAY